MSHTYFDSENGHKSFEMPGARPHYNPDRPGQVEHIFLDLVLDIPKQSFRGTCSIRINPVRSGIDKLTLDAVNLNIKSVKIGETEQNFDSDGEVLQIQLHEPTAAYEPITIAIEYSVEKPQRGLYFVGPDKH
ncbi:aminopeptidase, partial [filamentous cyanobacterium Phorm 46]